MRRWLLYPMMVLLIAISRAQAQAPYPTSTIATIAPVPATSEQHGLLSNGSDNWYMHWTSDGNIYALWGDGKGWVDDITGGDAIGGTRITNSPPGLTGTDVFASSAANYKPRGFASDAPGNTTLRGFYDYQTDGWNGSYVMTSDDNGSNWIFTGTQVFSESADNVKVMGMAGSGAGYSNFPSGVDPAYYYIYLGCARNEALCSDYTHVYLARVPRANIATRAAYEYYAGLDGSNNPIWTGTYGSKAAVYLDPNGVEFHVGVTWFPGINRWVLAVGHHETGCGTYGGCGLGIFEGLTPWGPWKTLYYSQFVDAYWKFTYQMPQKWMAGDGTSFWLAWSGYPEYDNISFMRFDVTPIGGGGSPTVNLTWDAPTENEDNSALTDLAGYNVLYGTVPSTYPSLKILTGATTSTTMTGLLAGSTYYFCVKARDTSGNVSPTCSNEVSALISGPPPSTTEVNVTWTASTNLDGDLSHYLLSWGPSTGVYTTTQNVGNVTAYLVPNLQTGTHYCFAARSVDTPAGNISAYSNEDCLTTAGTAAVPATPVFTLVASAPPQTTINWGAIAEATGYKLYRCQGAGCPITPPSNLIQTLGLVTTATDSGLIGNNVYGYAMTSGNGVGDSPLSAIQYVTMPPPPVGGCPGASYLVDPTNYTIMFSDLHTWVPGDIVTFAPGTYVGLTLRDIHGTAACPIVLTGPTSGPPAIIVNDGTGGNDTINLQAASYLYMRHLEIDSATLGHGINARSVSHHLLFEDLYIHNCASDQGYVALAANSAPQWNWTIRRVTITDCGTGMYLGYPDTAPFLAGLLEYNLVYDTIGYGVQIKEQNALPDPGPAGMPTVTTTTIVRYNTFSKANNNPSGPSCEPDCADFYRPTLLVGHAPTTGPAAAQENGYAIYGNFFYENPVEAHFQGAGNIALYDNLFVNSQNNNWRAVSFQAHSGGSPRKIFAFHNSIVQNGADGLVITGADTGVSQYVAGNAVFAGGTPLSGGTQTDNITGSYPGSSVFTNPTALAGSGLDLFPLPGQLSDGTMNIPGITGFPDSFLDFNGVNRGANTIRGAYATNVGSNPGWMPVVAIQTPRVVTGPSPSAPANLRVIGP